MSDPKDPDQYKPLEKHDYAAAVAANAAMDRAGFWSISLVLIRGYSSAKHALCRPGYDGSGMSLTPCSTMPPPTHPWWPLG